MTSPIGLSDIFPVQLTLYLLSILALLIPAPAHFKSGNPGIILSVCWLLACQSIFLLNAIVWRGNVNNPFPFWCDLSTAVIAVVPIGYSASILCITRQLYRLSRVTAVITTKSEKRKQLIVDLCVGLGLPILAAGGHAIVQGHRYDIYEDWGCVPTTYNVTLAFPLFVAPPLLVNCISAVYGMLALRQFLKRRESFESFLSSNSGMHQNHYLRLMWLCSYDLLIGIPWQIFNIVDAATNLPVDPWVSWAITQADWYRIDYYRRIIIDENPYARITLITYMCLSTSLSFLFFALFGFTHETMLWYHSTFRWVLTPFGVEKTSKMIPWVNAPKKTRSDRLFRREAIPLNSFSNTASSILESSKNTYAHSEANTVGQTTSLTDTLGWQDEPLVIVVNDRLSIPELRRGMPSFENEVHFGRKQSLPRIPLMLAKEAKPFHSLV